MLEARARWPLEQFPPGIVYAVEFEEGCGRTAHTPNATPKAQNASTKLMFCEPLLPVQAMYAWPFQPTAAGATPVLP